MKNLLFSLLVAALVIAGTSRSLAHYEHDDSGWFDEHHHHHDFVRHNGHRGY